ncbi:MAG: restriction endonuclease subunit S [Fibrobacter sp.]|nr:restriction endonuclease subunit S [Fibrobacter sp.]
MKYIKLSECAYFSDKRTTLIDVDSYISTENMVPNKGGIVKADSIPDVKSTSKYEVNDILLSNIRPYFCKIWLADKDGGCSNDVLVLKTKKRYEPKFLYYVLSDQNFFNYDTVTSKGTKMPRGTPNAIMKYLVPDIDVNTQKKFVSILSAYDNLIENNNKRIKTLEQMAENLYKEWFVRFRFPGHETTPFENGIPKGWKIEKIKNCVKRLPFGKTYKEAELEKEGSIIVIDQSTEPFIGYHNDVAAHQANAKNPIILFGDHSCKFVLMTRDFSLGENIVPFISYNDEIVNPYYLFFATHKIIETTEYKRHWGEFVNKKILIPTIDLQKEFARTSTSIKSQLEQLLLENQNLIKQRDLLLPRLMSGKQEISNGRNNERYSK